MRSRGRQLGTPPMEKEMEKWKTRLELAVTAAPNSFSRLQNKNFTLRRASRTNRVVARLAARRVVNKTAEVPVRLEKCSRLFVLVVAARRKFRSVRAAIVRFTAAIASTNNKAVNFVTKVRSGFTGSDFFLACLTFG